MADERVSIEIEIEAARGAQTLGELREGFDNLNKRIEEVPRASKEFKQLSEAIAATGREIKNVELGFESLDNEQVASELGSLAGAVGDVSAAFVLLGDESETMEEITKNIEQAIGVSMAFKGAIEGLSSAQKLYNNLVKAGKIQTVLSTAATKAQTVAQKALALATGTGTKAMKGFRLALILTGIGALIVGLGLLITNFEKVKNFVGGLKSNTEAWGEQNKKTFNAIKIALKIVFAPMLLTIKAITTALEFLGIIDDEQTKKRKANAAARRAVIIANELKVIKAFEDSLAAQKRITEEAVKNLDWEIAQRQAAGEDVRELEREKLVTLKEGLEAEMQILNARNDAIRKAALAELEARSLNNEFLTKALEIALAESEAFEKRREQQQLQTLEELEQQIILHDIKVEKEEKESRARRLQQQKDADDKWMEEADRLRRRRVEAKQLENEELNQKEEERANAFVLIAQQIEREEEERRKREEERHKARIAEINEELELREAQIGAVQGGVNVLKSLNDLADRDSIRAQERAKKLAVSQLAIDTASSISSTIAGASKAAAAGGPAAPFLLAGYITSGLATVLGAFVSARNILQEAGGVSLGGLSSVGGGIGAGGAVFNPVSNTSTIVDDQTGQGPMQVFVTEQDISDTQNKVAVIEQQATF